MWAQTGSRGTDHMSVVWAWTGVPLIPGWVTYQKACRYPGRCQPLPMTKHSPWQVLIRGQLRRKERKGGAVKGAIRTH